MEITKVTFTENRTLIPLVGWEAVRNALTAFAGGAPGGRSAEAKTMDVIEEDHGGMAVGLALLGSAVASTRKNTFLEDILTEAERTLKKQTHFQRDHDYEAMGTPFFKAMITVKKISADIYGLGVSAAYVGDEPEAGLAARLNVPRMLSSCVIEVETKPLSGDRFEFDFEPVLRKLDPVLETNRVSGAEAVSALMSRKPFEHAGFLLKKQAGLILRLEPGNVDGHHTWTARGGVLTGDLARDYEARDKGTKLPPTFCLTVCAVDKKDQRVLMWRDIDQARALDLGKKIFAALQ